MQVRATRQSKAPPDSYVRNVQEETEMDPAPVVLEAETGGKISLRKRTNMDVEPERITRSNILEYTLTKSQNNIHVRSY